MRLITTTNLGLSYGARIVLEGVNIGINRGEIVAIVGPNGSGKSSPLRALIGALPPRRGKVTRAPGLRIGYVPQKLQIDASLPLTVSRFLNLPHKTTPTAIEAALADAGVSDLGTRQMAQLSGGQFQRVLLARALLSTPDILIQDEATQDLD